MLREARRARLLVAGGTGVGRFCSCSAGCGAGEARVGGFAALAVVLEELAARVCDVCLSVRVLLVCFRADFSAIVADSSLIRLFMRESRRLDESASDCAPFESAVFEGVGCRPGVVTVSCFVGGEACSFSVCVSTGVG